MTAPVVWTAASGPTGGAPVVVVHGSLDRSAGLLRLSRRLDDRFRVVRYDRRGYARSAPHPGPFAIVDQIDDLVAVIESIGAGTGRATQPALVIGHSFGGNIALGAADRRPDLIAAVVTYESPLSWTDWWPRDSAGQRALRSPAEAPQSAELFMRSLIGDDRWERLPHATRAARRSEGPALIAELADLAARPPWDGRRVTAPVLALYGERGREAHRRAAFEIADSVVDGRCEAIADARHFGPNTHPAAVAERVLAFVDGPDPPPR